MKMIPRLHEAVKVEASETESKAPPKLSESSPMENWTFHCTVICTD